MKKLLKVTFLLMAFTMAFTSFAADNDIYGKWRTVANEQGVSAVSTYDFNPSGIVTQIFEINCPTPKIEIAGSGACKFTYKDNTITFKFNASDLNFSKFYIEGVDKSLINAAIEQQRKEMTNQTFRMTDVKVTGDTMTAISDGQKITLTRVK